MTDLRTIHCHHAGADLAGQLAMPATPGPHPAVLVMHNAHGLGEHMRVVAGRLAGLGYAALATDMYGGGAYLPDRAAAGAAIAPLWNDAGLLRSRAVAWLELNEDWSVEDGPLMFLAPLPHVAYHLGAMRAILKVVEA